MMMMVLCALLMFAVGRSVEAAIAGAALGAFLTGVAKDVEREHVASGAYYPPEAQARYWRGIPVITALIVVVVVWAALVIP